MKEQEIEVSDFNKLAVLDLNRIRPLRSNYDGRYRVYFRREDVEKIICDYENGLLTVVARDFVSSIKRVKDRIFESERELRLK